MAIDFSSSTTDSLAPGFRFHPTDEELVRYYLRRKICGKSFRVDAISEIDIYKTEPWDLPGKSKLKSRDLEWYFFSVLDKKYGNGSRTNRATDRGYWKTTGKDRAVYHRSQVVGMKKTLVYHCGRAPRGERTNWVMHEYRLTDEDLAKSGIVQDAFVLCRVFRKSGSGPKNGEQYGAPFVEAEWENEEEEELAILSKDQSADHGTCLDEGDLQQIFGSSDPCEDSPPLNISNGDNFNLVQELGDISDDVQKFSVGMSENHSGTEHSDEISLFDLAMHFDNKNENSVDQGYIGGQSNPTNSLDADLDFLLNEPLLDAANNFQYQNDDTAFLETNDLKNPVSADNSGFDFLDDLPFFDANDDITPYLTFDPSEFMGTEGLFYDPASYNNDYLTDATQQQFFDGLDKDFSSSSYPKEETMSYKKASSILGNINAPPAFASEFPTKEVALRLNSASSQLNITAAGMIEMRNVNGNGIDLSSGKQGCVSILLSFCVSRADDISSDAAVTPTKTNSVVSWGWFCCMFVWVMFISLTLKIGGCVSQVGKFA
jgi:hypothetical protein